MTASLEQQLADLAEIHRLDGISLNFHKGVGSGRIFYTATLHRAGRVGTCSAKDNAVDAFKAAITSLNETALSSFGAMERAA